MRYRTKELSIAGHYPQIVGVAQRLEPMFAEYGFAPVKVRAVDTSRFTSEQLRKGRSAEQIAQKGAEKKALEIQMAFHETVVLGNMLVVEFDGRALVNEDAWHPSALSLSGREVICHLGVCLRMSQVAQWSAPVSSKAFQIRTFRSESECTDILLRNDGRPAIPAMNPFSTRIGDVVEDPESLEAFVASAFTDATCGLLRQWTTDMKVVTA